MVQLVQIYTLRVQIVINTSIVVPHIQIIKNNSIIYTRTLRLRNICIYGEDFDKHALNMKSWFLQRGCSKQMIDLQMEKVEFGQRLKAGSKQAGFGGPFVLKYHPKLKKIAQIMEKLEHLLYRDESVKGVFTSPSMVSYRSAKKLSSSLVRAKVYPLERKKAPISVAI